MPETGVQLCPPLLRKAVDAVFLLGRRSILSPNNCNVQLINKSFGFDDDRNDMLLLLVAAYFHDVYIRFSNL